MSRDHGVALLQESECRPFSVDHAQTIAAVREADAAARLCAERARVGHADVQLAGVTERLDADENGPAALLDAVFERVLDERLEDQRRHRGLPRLLGDVPLDAGAIDESLAHDVGVEAQQVQFLAQRRLRRAVRLQVRPQQVREAHEQAIGTRDVHLHQRGDRVQRVEQEVRLELRAQARQLGLREVPLQHQQSLAFVLPPEEALDAEDHRQPQRGVQEQHEALVHVDLRPRPMRIGQARQRIHAVPDREHRRDGDDREQREPDEVPAEPSGGLRAATRSIAAPSVAAAAARAT